MATLDLLVNLTGILHFLRSDSVFKRRSEASKVTISVNVVNCLKILMTEFVEIRLYINQSKTSTFFVHCKLQFFTMEGTVAPSRPSKFFQTGSYRLTCI